MSPVIARCSTTSSKRWQVIGPLPMLIFLAGCFTMQAVPQERAKHNAPVEVRFQQPMRLSIRAADSATYPVTLLRGRLLRSSATGDSIWLRPDSVVGHRHAASGTHLDQGATGCLHGPWVDRVLVVPAPGEVQYLGRRFSTRRTLVAAGTVALTWVLYVVYDMAVNGPFKET